MRDKSDDTGQRSGDGQEKTPRQEQASQQSQNATANAPGGRGARHLRPNPAKPGSGSSQGQDGGTGGTEQSAPAWPSAGTPDIERSSAESQDSGRNGSMVNDSTGAFKERP